MEVELGARRYDITSRSLVMGILNRTPDSFFDQGGYYRFDDFLQKAEQLVVDGADLLDVGGVKAGPGDEVSEAEELDRVVPAIEALRARFDVPVSVDTWRASVAKAAFAVGAVVGNDISGFADPEYLTVAAAAGASVVATHIRFGPAFPTRTRVRRLVGDGRGVPAPSGRRVPRRPASPASGSSSTPASISARRGTVARAAARVRALAALGYPVLLSASNKRSSACCSTSTSDERREATSPRTRSASRSAVASCEPTTCAALDARPMCSPRVLEAACRDGCHLPAAGADPALLRRRRQRARRTQLVGDDDRVAGRRRHQPTRRTRSAPHRRRGPHAAFLTTERVVVGRHIEQFTRQDDVAPLVDYLADPLDTTELVLVGRRHRAQGARRGREEDRPTPSTTDPAPREREGVARGAVQGGRRQARSPARELVVERLGEDLGRLPALLDGLEATYGPGAGSSADDVEPFLGEAGGFRRGSSPTRSIGRHRGRARSPAPHDGRRRAPSASDHGDAVTATTAACCDCRAATSPTRSRRPRCSGCKGSTFPATQGARSGAASRSAGCGEGVRAAGRRRSRHAGRVGWPDDLVLEVLVARLSRLGGAGGRRPARTARRPSFFMRRRLAPGGLVLVDDPLGGGLVESLLSQLPRGVGVLAGAPASGTAALTRVFSSDRTALLRSARFTFWRLRFFWLLMFATEIPSIEPVEATSDRPNVPSQPR